jgi:mRNA-degrading endonuclease RelE of RelBE toxin-antitoxin system
MLKNRLSKVLIVALGTLLITVLLNWLNYTVFLGLFVGFLGWSTWEQKETAHQLLQRAQLENQMNLAMRTANSLLQNELQEVRMRSQTIKNQLETEIETKAQIEQRIRELSNQLSRHQTINQDYQAQINQLELQFSQSQSSQHQLIEQELKNRDEYISLIYDELKAEQSKRQEAEASVEQYHNQIQALGAETIALKESLGQANRKLEGFRIDQQPQVEEIEKTSGQYNLKFEYWGDFEDLPDREYKKVMGKLLALQSDPRPRDCDHLRKFISKHGKVYRVRSGDYRICYVIEESCAKQIRVLMVDNRNERIYDERLGSRLN